MSTYKRYLLFAVVGGVIEYFTPIYSEGQISLTFILRSLSFGGLFLHGYFLSYVQSMLPMILFQICFGTYIYQHYSTGSVYYFSRQPNRGKWFMKESFKLFLFSLTYTIILLTTAFVLHQISRGVVVHRNQLILVPYFILVFSLWNFAMALLINVLAMKIKSHTAFIFVLLSQFVQIAAFDLVETFYDPVAEISRLTSTSEVRLQLIPFAHNVLEWHSSTNPTLNAELNALGINFPLSRTLLLFAVISLICLIVGKLVVDRHEILVYDLDADS